MVPVLQHKNPEPVDVPKSVLPCRLQQQGKRLELRVVLDPVFHRDPIKRRHFQPTCSSPRIDRGRLDVRGVVCLDEHSESSTGLVHRIRLTGSAFVPLTSESYGFLEVTLAPLAPGGGQTGLFGYKLVGVTGIIP
jgi:hypothetical protein